jgi:hypothetical protein
MGTEPELDLKPRHDRLMARLGEVEKRLEALEASFEAGFAQQPQDLTSFITYALGENPDLAAELAAAEAKALIDPEWELAERRRSVDALETSLGRTRVPEPSGDDEQINAIFAEIRQLVMEIAALTPEVIALGVREREEGQAELRAIYDKIASDFATSRSSLEGYISVKNPAVAQRIADLEAAGPLDQHGQELLEALELPFRWGFEMLPTSLGDYTTFVLQTEPGLAQAIQFAELKASQYPDSAKAEKEARITELQELLKVVDPPTPPDNPIPEPIQLEFLSPEMVSASELEPLRGQAERDPRAAVEAQITELRGQIEALTPDVAEQRRREREEGERERDRILAQLAAAFLQARSLDGYVIQHDPATGAEVAALRAEAITLESQIKEIDLQLMSPDP